MNCEPGNEKNGLEENDEFSYGSRSSPGKSWLSRGNHGYQGSPFVGSGISGWCFLSPPFAGCQERLLSALATPALGHRDDVRQLRTAHGQKAQLLLGSGRDTLRSCPSPAFKSALIHGRIIILMVKSSY